MAEKVAENQKSSRKKYKKTKIYANSHFLKNKF